MRISEIFQSRFLKAADLGGREARVVIDHVEMVDLDADQPQRPALFFVGKSKSMVINRTNGELLAKSFGDDCDAWRGRSVIIFCSQTVFQGRVVDCLRLRIPAGQQPSAPQQQPPVQQDEAMQFGAGECEPRSDDCPF